MSGSISSASGFNPAAMMQRMGGAGGMKGMQPPTEMMQKFEAQFKSDFQTAANQAGVDGSKFAEIGGKIQDALKDVDLSSSDDPQATIESTINTVLKDNGIDADQFKADFQKVMDKMPKPDFASMGGGFGGGMGGVSGSNGTYSASSSQQDQLQQLLDQLFKGDGKDQNSQIASFFSQASAGTFLDTAA
jgi:hypothetical protein